MIQARSTSLQTFFSALTEHSFFTELGFADTQVVDYLSQMLVRFAHRDGMYMRANSGQPLEQLSEMLSEAERTELTAGKRRELYRHAGDFSLFWLGLFPEALRRSAGTPMVTVAYTEQGKRSYYVASTYSDSKEHASEAPVLRQLSEHFEECADGLARVRLGLQQGS